MYSAVGMNEDRVKYMAFSNKTLYSTPYVFVTRKDDTVIKGFTDIKAKNKKLALIENYTIHGLMKTHHPNQELVLLKSVKEGFNQLLDKHIDAFLVNKSTAQYFINILNINELYISYETDLKLDLLMTIRNDWPDEVLSIINKSIDAIDEQFFIDIYNKWGCSYLDMYSNSN